MARPNFIDHQRAANTKALEMTVLTFTTEGDELGNLVFEANNLVLAGWTGRDRAAIEHHIEELSALGVAPPSATPMFYRTGVELLTQAENLQVLGPNTSGEVEYVLLATDTDLWITVGSDQTDRQVEATGIALSKQLAGKVLATTAWRLADLSERWDELSLRSWATIDGERVLYQEALLGTIETPGDLISKYTGGAAHLAPGTVMMSGTSAAIGGIRPAARFDMELARPDGRVIQHGYSIEVLPVVS